MHQMFSKKISESYNQPHSKRVAIIIIFLPKICYFLVNFSRHNLIKYAPKRTKLHHISKIFAGNIRPQGPIKHMPVTSIGISI